MKPKSVFIVGCGALGRRLAALWREHGAEVGALARSVQSADELATLGLAVVRGDLDRPATLAEAVPAGALLYYLAPPPPRGAEDPRLRALLAAIAPGNEPRRIVYISTSGVYGDQGGGWVDEDSPARPGSDRARRRLDAEQSLQHWGSQRHIPVIILRVAGIYGPERLPVARLRRGEAVLSEAESGYSNRIHIDDLVQACLAAGERGRSGGIYNAADDAPSTMTDYFTRIAARLGLPAPPQVNLAEARQRLSPAMLEYLTESRRLSNRRLHEELGVTLRYPSLADGLAALSKEDVELLLREPH